MIISFGTYDKERHPRVAIIIDGLRSHGHEVTELNRPLGFSTAERVRMLKQPWRAPMFVFRLLARWTVLIRDARRLTRSNQPVDTVIVGYMGHFDVLLARLLFRNANIILDHLIFAGDTAKDRGTGGFKARLLSSLDRRAIRTADIVVVDTQQHCDMLPDSAHGVVVPVGARSEWFEAEGPLRGSEDQDPLSVVFFGLYTPLQGATHIAEGIAAALDKGAALRATLIGTGQDWESARDALGDRTDVVWLDWVDPAELPAIVAAHDISLGIFGTTPKALRVVPNKVYESAAAGCAVITSDTVPQRHALGHDALLVAPGDSDSLARTLVSLAQDRDQVRGLRAAARHRASQFSAGNVVEPLLPFVGNAS